MAVFLTGACVALDLFPIPSSHIPGDVITWDDKEWLVCHYDSNMNQVYLITKDIISENMFGSFNTYNGSTLASEAISYQRDSMSSKALTRCVNVIVNSVIAKVFVPSFEQFNGGFSWFTSNTNRIAQYQGTDAYYWTSSTDPDSSMSNYSVVAVASDGSIGFGMNPQVRYGFRPCVCVQL